MSDKKLAKQLKRSMNAVAQRRFKFNIPAFNPTVRMAWTKAEDALLGTMSDNQLATALGRTAGAISNRRSIKKATMIQWTEPMIAVITDSSINDQYKADLFKVPVQAITILKGNLNNVK